MLVSHPSHYFYKLWRIPGARANNPCLALAKRPRACITARRQSERISAGREKEGERERGFTRFTILASYIQDWGSLLPLRIETERRYRCVTPIKLRAITMPPWLHTPIKPRYEVNTRRGCEDETLTATPIALVASGGSPRSWFLLLSRSLFTQLATLVSVCTDGGEPGHRYSSAATLPHSNQNVERRWN